MLAWINDVLVNRIHNYHIYRVQMLLEPWVAMGVKSGGRGDAFPGR